MGLRLNGCCCMRLRTAGLLHGWLSVVFSCILIVITIMRLRDYNDNKDFKNTLFIEEKAPFDIYQWFTLAKHKNGEIIALVIYLCDAFFSSLLIIGIIKKNYNMLMPWLVFRGIGLILLVRIAVGVLQLASLSNDVDVVSRALSVAFITGLYVWIWIVIYSLYEEIRKKVKNAALKRHMARSRQEPLPYIESGVNGLPAYRMYDTTIA